MKIQEIPRLAAIRAGLLTAAGVMAVGMCGVSRAGLAGPYAVDGNTLHLWHFDETVATPSNAPTNALAFDAVTNNLQTSQVVLSNTPGRFNGSSGVPDNFALQGQPAFSAPGSVSYNYS